LVDNRVGCSFNYPRADSRGALTEPLVAQLLGAEKTEAERGHPGEAGRATDLQVTRELRDWTVMTH
jgi:hypothetical protein